MTSASQALEICMVHEPNGQPSAMPLTRSGESEGEDGPRPRFDLSPFW